jgi:hypothetical protein
MSAAKRFLKTADASLARPGCHPDPIDPHASIGRLIEAFDEVFDLGEHLFVSHGLGGLVSTSIIMACWKCVRCRLGVDTTGAKRREWSPVGRY